MQKGATTMPDERNTPQEPSTPSTPARLQGAEGSPDHAASRSSGSLVPAIRTDAQAHAPAFALIPRLAITALLVVLLGSITYVVQDATPHARFLESAAHRAMTPAARGTVLPSPAATLDTEVAHEAIDDAFRRATDCARGLSGRSLFVQVTFTPNGVAVSAWVMGLEDLGSDRAYCFEKAFLAARVPRFLGGDTLVTRRYRVP